MGTPSVKESSVVRWYVMRAYKSEKRAESHLSVEPDMDCFIPKRYAVRSYHGVKSKRLVPAVPSLVFVRASRSRIVDFKRRYNYLQFATWEKSTGLEYLTVPDDQMSSFMKVASEHEDDLQYYRPEDIDLCRGVRVRIHGGRLDGVEGTFIRVQGKRDRRIVVVLDGILAVSAEVHPDLVEVIG